MTATVFIDGEAGTTGLQIRSRLEPRKDIRLVHLDEARRKDAGARAEAMNGADIVILCLPDDAAREAVTLVDNPDVRVIDASSAHRTAEGWEYGFPEYAPDQRARIRDASRLTNPGCYAISAVSMLHPLVAAGVLPGEFPATVNAVSGYTGGGRKLIAEFEDRGAPDYSDAAYWVYGLGLEHKHVGEIRRWGSLAHRPVFVPSVGRYRQGMIVQLPLQLWSIPGAPTPGQVHAALADHYAGERYVEVAPLAHTAAMQRLDPQALNGTNTLRLHVFANDRHGQAVVMAVIDNLGKGASGQAVQNLNILLGAPEETGLDIPARVA